MTVQGGSASVVAVIPARGGSKGVPGKNLAPVAGVPLVVRAIRACLAAGRVDEVVVSTDDEGIAAVAERAGAIVVRRPAELANDTASSEAALRHVLQVRYPDQAPEVLLLVQCTSPFITAAEVDEVVAAILERGADSAFTAAPFHGFIWRVDDSAYGVNHDHRTRPRRQERPAEYLETGAAYAMRTEGFLAAGHRFFGNVQAVPTDPARVLEIDEPDDLARARAIAGLLETERPVLAKGAVQAVVLDFDGTQTDDRVWITADGVEQVAVHRGDGMGIAALRDAGLPILILSTEVNDVLTARAKKLRIECVHSAVEKQSELRAWCRRVHVDPEAVVYVGNDLNDLGCLQIVGWPVAVANAHPAVKQAAAWTTAASGGHGAVREVAAWILGEDLSGGR
ncbi:YrbI family 3-deoxy-D-manno-octulosonate 8-phosphate phosphatase [Propionicimonas paludicola]|uniref:N-acylneuraminate cytidylyltransferase n=1 Tax=Propionicimonas paludicola TaxID=185243 RepID=A0A2A9CVC6_9ACTN|nr:acylneuraminate cytidylyltransferase [Propionicimonas paludicola]PFG18363.1 YrbI family 3-deoxy-D-manno-octulosonate 8-phosphate phosphatase [Propionicimonas paludicola]